MRHPAKRWRTRQLADAQARHGELMLQPAALGQQRGLQRGGSAPAARLGIAIALTGGAPILVALNGPDGLQDPHLLLQLLHLRDH